MRILLTAVAAALSLVACATQPPGGSHTVQAAAASPAASPPPEAVTKIGPAPAQALAPSSNEVPSWAPPEAHKNPALWIAHKKSINVYAMCLVFSARKYTGSTEPTETVVRAAFGNCQNDRARLLDSWAYLLVPHYPLPFDAIKRAEVGLKGIDEQTRASLIAQVLNDRAKANARERPSGTP